MADFSPRSHVTADQPSTASLILVMLDRVGDRPMTTYELGLWIADNKHPPRPLSIIVKNLANDDYVRCVEKVGKRVSLWSLTERGRISAKARTTARDHLENLIATNACVSALEIDVLQCLSESEPINVSQICRHCNLLMSPTKTALKRLTIRHFVERSNDVIPTYHLNERGLKALSASK